MTEALPTRLAALEARVLEPWIEKVYGRERLALVPAWYPDPPALGSGADAGWWLRLAASGAVAEGAFRCEPLSLPIQNRALSLVVDLHVADAATDLDGLLGEYARVLVPEGLLVIVACNGISVAGRRLRLPDASFRRRGLGFWRARIQSQGLELLLARGIGPLVGWRRPTAPDASPPSRLARGLERLRGLHMLLVRKRETSLIPLRWRGRERFRGRRSGLVPGMGRAWPAAPEIRPAARDASES